MKQFEHAEENAKNSRKLVLQQKHFPKNNHKYKSFQPL